MYLLVISVFSAQSLRCSRRDEKSTCWTLGMSVMMFFVVLLIVLNHHAVSSSSHCSLLSMNRMMWKDKSTVYVTLTSWGIHQKSLAMDGFWAFGPANSPSFVLNLHLGSPSPLPGSLDWRVTGGSGDGLFRREVVMARLLVPSTIPLWKQSFYFLTAVLCLGYI